MLMKNWIATPTNAAHRNVRPACEAMYGNRMYSPLATPTPTRITLGPISRRSGAGSGRSRSTAWSSGAAAARAVRGRSVSVLWVLIGSPPSLRGLRPPACASAISASTWRSIRSRSGRAPVNSSIDPAACSATIAAPLSVRQPRARAPASSSVSIGM